MNKYHALKRFINDKTQYIAGRFSWLHDMCKQPVEDTGLNTQQTPYQIVSLWLLEVVGYGFIVTFVWNSWFGYQGLLKNIILLFANGFAVWMYGELIHITKQSMKER